MIILIALLLTLAGAVLVYLASAQQRLRVRALPSSAKWAGAALVAAGTACWWYDAGVGPGITAALTMLMLTWVTLPYLSWWRTASEEAGES
ncbi:hypothetical protein [Dyella sp. C11]|uniref:hypothetical protein n=1 Tax=Dyella sp. C11 TaxID=2126991 RepID=UPI000D65E040|nr:hypothetical protein [Dyella sp. C11]